MDMIAVFNGIMAVFGSAIIYVYLKNLRRLKRTQLEVDETLEKLQTLTEESKEISSMGMEVRQLYETVKHRMEYLHQQSSRIETEIMGIRTAAVLSSPNAINARCDSILNILSEVACD